MTKPKKSRSLPCTDQIMALPLDTPPELQDPRYRSGVGKLDWLVTMTRFDLAYALSLPSLALTTAGVPHT